MTGATRDPLGAGFDENSSDSFDAANAGVHDYSGALALLIPWRLTGVVPGVRNLLSKKVTTGTQPGYAAYVQPGAVVFVADAGVPVGVYSFFSWTDDTALHYTLFWRSVSTELIGVTADVGSDTSVFAGTYSPTNAATFSLGQGYYVAPSVVLGPTIIWSGANAEYVIANRVSRLAAWSEATGVF